MGTPVRGRHRAQGAALVATAGTFAFLAACGADPLPACRDLDRPSASVCVRQAGLDEERTLTVTLAAVVEAVGDRTPGTGGFCVGGWPTGVTTVRALDLRASDGAAWTVEVTLDEAPAITVGEKVAIDVAWELFVWGTSTGHVTVLRADGRVALSVAQARGVDGLGNQFGVPLAEGASTCVHDDHCGDIYRHSLLVGEGPERIGIPPGGQARLAGLQVTNVEIETGVARRRCYDWNPDRAVVAAVEVP